MRVMSCLRREGFVSASNRKSTVKWYYKANSGIRGEKIIGQAFKVEEKPLVHASGRHRRQVCFLRDAKCVIDRAFRPTQ